MQNNLVIGVDIGGTRTKAGLVDTVTGRVQHCIIQPTEKADARLFVQGMGQLIQQLREHAVMTACRVSAIGIGVPGFTREKGVVETTYGFLEFMENYPLKEIIETEFSLPCFIDNDARVVSMGEALYGKGKGFGRVLTLTLGTGVGFGFVVNGKFPDQLPLAHMAGHMSVTDTGSICYCGKLGCLEALVSSTGIMQLAKESEMEQAGSVEEVFAAAKTGDETAQQVIKLVIKYLHTAIHNYVNLYAPDMVVLGGGIAKGLVPYLAKIKGHSYLAPYPAYTFQLVVSELEEWAGMLGSAALYTSPECKINT